eukprot:10222030-Prorocentrum_lima.AAC.1
MCIRDRIWIKTSLVSQVLACSCDSPRCTSVDIALANHTLRVVSAHAPTETAPPAEYRDFLALLASHCASPRCVV